MLNVIKRCTPTPVKKAIKRGLWLFGRRPELEYLETHLTDHCNLNCKRCGHFSSLASSYFTDVHQFALDMLRLRVLFHKIHRIRLMGGEPLLHPEAAAFILIARDAFPKADLRFVTNGILMLETPDDFWNACRNTKTTIDLTVYPPFRDRVAALISLCRSKGVELNVGEKVEKFDSHLNLEGSSNPDKTFDACRAKYYCPFLQQGHFYVCSTPALIHYFNERFDYKIPADSGIDIHAQSVSGREILRYLNRPIETCRWCADDRVPLAWSSGKMGPEDWDASRHRKTAETTRSLA